MSNSHETTRLLLDKYDENDALIEQQVYQFNKDTLFKVLTEEFNIKNPKQFIEDEYTSDDTSMIIDGFYMEHLPFKRVE
mgnify:CR=1 FL=1